jgi:hypothetical protein
VSDKPRRKDDALDDYAFAKTVLDNSAAPADRYAMLTMLGNIAVTLAMIYDKMEVRK